MDFLERLPQDAGAALQLEGGGGGGFGFEGGDGFDQARDGESIADAALATDQVESAALAGEGDGKLD